VVFVGASACFNSLVLIGMHAMLCCLNGALAESDNMVVSKQVLSLAVPDLRAEHEVVPPIQAQIPLRAVFQV